MLTKRVPVCSAFPTCLKFGALLLLSVWPVAHGQCPQVFSYQKDQRTNQLYGLIELRNLRIGQVVKLNVDFSVGVAVPRNNIGSIELVQSKEQTIRGIYNNQPAQYRVNFPITNVIPKVLTITVNGQTICTGEKAKGKFVTTISHQHTLLVKLEPLSNSNGNNVRPQQVQTPRPQLQSTVLLNASAWSDDECGIPAKVIRKRSVDGKVAYKGQFPWAVPIFDTRKATKPKFNCGSTILNKFHLVTTASCLYYDGILLVASDLLAIPGMYNIDNFFESDIQIRDVASVIAHPDYVYKDDPSAENDIALMVLQQAIMYNDLVRPICMWDKKDDIDDIVGLTGIVSGFGMGLQDNLKTANYVNVKVLADDECQRSRGDIFLPENGMFCAEGLDGIPCVGDAGSAFVMKQGSRFYIRGMVSIGSLDGETLFCNVNMHTIYTDIAPFRFWLKKVMNTKTNK